MGLGCRRGICVSEWAGKGVEEMMEMGWDYDSGKLHQWVSTAGGMESTGRTCQFATLFVLQIGSKDL